MFFQQVAVIVKIRIVDIVEDSPNTIIRGFLRRLKRAPKCVTFISPRNQPTVTKGLFHTDRSNLFYG